MSRRIRGGGGQPPDDDAKDPIDLRCLNKAGLLRRARRILAEIAAGTPYMQFKGERRSSDRAIVRIALGPHWRLIFRDEAGSLVPIACMSHADYDKWPRRR